MSAQFDIKNRVKTTQAAVVQPIPAAAQPNPAQNPAPSNTDKVLEMLTLSLMFQQQQQQQHLVVPNVAPPPFHPPPHQSPIPSAPQSPAKPTHRPVSLGDFCAHYDIMQHFERLQKLEYEPGDGGIKTLGRDDWQNFAGFSKLAWDKVLSKHKQFLLDIQNGLWE